MSHTDEPRKPGEPPPGGSPVPRKIRIEPDGSVRLPEEFVQAMNLAEDRVVMAEIIDGQLRMTDVSEWWGQAQGMFAHLKKPGESVVDEFLAERRAMWGEE